MKKTVIAAILLKLLATPALAVAEPSWTWSFASESLTISPAWEPIRISVTVKNDATSTSTLQLNGFDFFDGSFEGNGILKDADGQPLITFLQQAPTPSILAPGEELTYEALFGVRTYGSVVDDAISRGDTYTLNPLYHVGDPGGNSWSYSGRAAGKPFTVQFSAVPEPSSIAHWLLGLPLLFLAHLRFKRPVSSPQT